MVDPIVGRYGSLVVSGWIAEAPTGSDEAYLLLTTPDERAPITMAIVAATLGVDLERPGRRTQATAVEIGEDLWAHLLVGGGRHSRPVSREWAEVARRRRRVVLVVGTAPLPPGMEADAYTDQHSGTAGIALAPVI